MKAHNKSNPMEAKTYEQLAAEIIAASDAYFIAHKEFCRLADESASMDDDSPEFEASESSAHEAYRKADDLLKKLKALEVEQDTLLFGENYDCQHDA